jgi:hypothetical protein
MVNMLYFMKKYTFVPISWASMIPALFFVSSCTTTEPKPNLVVPDTYESANYEVNVTTERTLRNELLALTTAMGVAESNAKLNNNTVTPSITYSSTLKSATETVFADSVAKWLVELVTAANEDVAFDIVTAPAGNGGLLGNRLLNKYGVELNQIIEKSAYGAMLHQQALKILSEPLTVASIDKLIEIFGAHPSFPGDDEAVVNPDIFSAKYAKLRSNNSGKTGFYYNIKYSLIAAKAAIEAGSAYNEELVYALQSFLVNWELSNFATVVFYLNDAKTKIAEAKSLSDPAKQGLLGEAMHSYSGGVAFIYGWLSVLEADKIITNAQIKDLLKTLKFEVGKKPESYKYTQPDASVADFDTAINKIKAIFVFTDAQINGFKNNN